LQQRKSSKFTNSLRFSENQADSKILAPHRKIGRFEKYWRLTEK
jgi:hypothetical protein